MLETLLCILTLSLVCPSDSEIDSKPQNKPVINQTNENITEVPEPLTGIFIGTTMAGLGAIALKKKKRTI